MNDPNAYVQIDHDGVMRVGDCGVPIDSVIAGFEQGQTPETIRSQYPSLRLEEVYGAIAYYLAHRQEVEGYLARQDVLWDTWRKKLQQDEPPVIERLRSLRESHAGKRA